MSAPPPVLHIDNLSKTFRDFWQRPRAKAVQDLSLEVRPGEVYGLLGPNGSGKSTTIKMILGLLHPSTGRIEVFGQSPRHTATKMRIGYLPEHSTLYPYLNARESLHFTGALFGLSRRVREERIDALLDMVGLSHTGARRVGEFSKGMARRIGLAQSLINDPDLVILDEPTSGLDPLGTRQVKDIILALAQRGKTVLLSSHLLADVQDVCDRISILYGGVERAAGELGELLQRQDQLSVSLGSVEPEQRQRIETALREILAHPVDLRPEQQSLEAFFLDVIARVRAESADSSGASGEGELAAFLGEVSPKTSSEAATP